MTDPKLAPISAQALDEHWFSLRIKTWKAVTKAVQAIAVDQKQLAARIGMDAGQFNKIITGRKSNVTLRTLHNIARAANHRLQISLVPLAELPRPNYSYDAQKREGRLIERRTDTQSTDDWTQSGKVLEMTDL